MNHQETCLVCIYCVSRTYAIRFCFLPLLHNSYKDEQTNHDDDNYFCHKIKTTLFPAGTLSANTGQKNVWATCWRCFYQLSSSTNSVTIIHRFFANRFWRQNVQSLSGVRDGPHGLGLPSLPARHLLHGGFWRQQRSNYFLTLLPSILDSCMTRLK